MQRILKIATRKSDLALWQANHVKSLLMQHHPGLEVELLPLVTQGDRILDKPLAKIGGKGLFLKELERALLDGQADLAVHSMKDVPVEVTAGLPVDIVLSRANPFDALVGRKGLRLDQLEAGARVGTSSLRRQCQIKSLRPDLTVLDLRGNVNTRLRKLEQGEYEAIILACAGLERLGLQHWISEQLSAPQWLPAVTQGTIGVQCRAEDLELQQLLQPLNDPATAVCSCAERAVSRRLHGSCQVPLAVFARFEQQALSIDALVGEPDGSKVVRSAKSARPENAEDLADSIAEDLIRQGADRIIEALSL